MNKVGGASFQITYFHQIVVIFRRFSRIFVCFTKFVSFRVRRLQVKRIIVYNDNSVLGCRRLSLMIF